MSKQDNPYIVLAIVLISLLIGFAMLRTTSLIQEVKVEPINENINPRIDTEKIFKLEEKKEIIREYHIEIDREMDIIARFIKKNNNRVPMLVADQIANSIVTRCSKHNLPNELIVGIIDVESTYDPYAIGPPVGRSKRRARGLGQVLDETCGNEDIMKDKLHNIDYNIEYTIKILVSKLKISNGDIDKALYLYVGQSDEYSAKVFRTMGEFRYFRAQQL